ncbi:MAG: nucleotidyltransferase family protein [Myxococcota bacterium]
MVLCAGYGTRLRPLTDELPKPLLPFGDRSFLGHALAALGAAGFAEVVVNVHHLREAFERCLPELGGAVRLVHEPVIRGTAGGIAGARPWLGPAPVIALIGDVVLERVPPGFAESAEFGGLTLAVAPRAAGNGTVGIGERGQVVRLRGELFEEEVHGGDYVGLCALGDVALAALPEQGCLVADYALPLLRRGGEVRTFRFTDGYVLPGDDLRSYWQSQLAWLRERKQAHFVGPDVALTAGIELVESLLGPGVVVSGEGRLERVVALPLARVQAPLVDAIVAPSGRIIRMLSNG